MSAAEPIGNRAKLWMDAWTAVARAETCRGSDVATSWANDALDAYDEKFVTVGRSRPRDMEIDPSAPHQRMRIVSDGTGAGTVIYVGDKAVADVHSLKIEVPSRSERVRITLEVDADIAVFAVVAPGDSSMLHGGKT